MNEMKKTDVTNRNYKYVGTRPIRPDGVPKVTGAARYGADYAPPGLAWGKGRRSPHPHAKIVSINPGKAKGLDERADAVGRGVGVAGAEADGLGGEYDELEGGEGPGGRRRRRRGCCVRCCPWLAQPWRREGRGRRRVGPGVDEAAGEDVLADETVGGATAASSGGDVFPSRAGDSSGIRRGASGDEGRAWGDTATGRPPAVLGSVQGRRML